MTCTEWKNPVDKLSWVHVDEALITVLYHPPKPVYCSDTVVDYIGAFVDELSHQFPEVPNVIAGDLNQLPNEDVVDRIGLTQIHQQLT